MTNYRNLIPGLALSLGLAGAAIWAAELPAMKSLGLSALTLAIVGGMIVGNTIYRFV
ncbi:YeiH family putative sulfate export transporter, partial [Bacillus pseudomycoides]